MGATREGRVGSMVLVVLQGLGGGGAGVGGARRG